MIVIWLPTALAVPLSEQLTSLQEPSRIVTTGAELELVLVDAQTLVLPADPRLLHADLLQRCDRARVRVIPLAIDDRSVALAAGFGLVAIREATARDVLAARLTVPVSVGRRAGGITAVWSGPGSVGRTTAAIALASVLAEQSSTCLVDADTYASSIGLALGIDTDRPGFAGVCRQVGRGAFDSAEYARTRDVVASGPAPFDVLIGLNRESRWPELRADRVTEALGELSLLADHVVVDVAPHVELDEAAQADGVLQRNEAAVATLASAHDIVAVTQADPVSIARVVRAYAALRLIAPHTPVTVLVNRMRQGAVGLDAKSQVRRALEHLTSLTEIVFAPEDQAAADRAMLRAQPLPVAAPKSAAAAAMRRLGAAIVEAQRSTPPVARELTQNHVG